MHKQDKPLTGWLMIGGNYRRVISDKPGALKQRLTLEWGNEFHGIAVPVRS